MPTIKTIKPAGGGDYTTLAAWWSARRTSGNADEWAECYSGGNLGGVTITGMTATTNATDYPKIYAATPHDGKTYNSGAYISGAGITVYTDYTQIVGLGLNGQIYTEYHGNSFLTIDSCIVHIASGVGMYLRDVNVSGERNVTNCNIKSGDNWGLLLIADAGLAITCLIANNTFNGTAYGIYIGASGYASFDVTLNNNAILATIYGVYEPGSYNTVRSSNNAASDTSVNGPPGSYSNWIVGTNITGVAATDLFEDAAGGDIRPKPGSALIHAGANLIADFTQDIVGHERPSVGPWDIGAFEYVPPYVEYDISYTYDAVGNRLTKVDVHEGTTTYTYDAANQLLSEVSPLGTINYAYDLNGNRIQKDDPVTGITNYTYDETNRMLTADPAGGQLVSLTYNGADQVVVKQNSAGTRKFVYDFKKLLLETKADNSTDLLYDFALNDEYGELTSRYHDATAGTDYYQYDGLGSTETMSDEAEAAVDVYRYKAFGEIVQQFGTEDNDFTFVGRQGYFYYPELELYFAGMQGGTGKPGRLLDPKTGQWTSQDPIRDNETNLYCYVRNNPVNATDPSGLVQVPAAIIFPEIDDDWATASNLSGITKYLHDLHYSSDSLRVIARGKGGTIEFWIILGEADAARVIWLFSPVTGKFIGTVIAPRSSWYTEYGSQNDEQKLASIRRLDAKADNWRDALLDRGTDFKHIWLEPSRAVDRNTPGLQMLTDLWENATYNPTKSNTIGFATNDGLRGTVDFITGIELRRHKDGGDLVDERNGLGHVRIRATELVDPEHPEAPNAEFHWVQFYKQHIIVTDIHGKKLGLEGLNIPRRYDDRIVGKWYIDCESYDDGFCPYYDLFGYANRSTNDAVSIFDAPGPPSESDWTIIINDVEKRVGNCTSIRAGKEFHSYLVRRGVALARIQWFVFEERDLSNRRIRNSEGQIVLPTYTCFRLIEQQHNFPDTKMLPEQMDLVKNMKGFSPQNPLPPSGRPPASGH